MDEMVSYREYLELSEHLGSMIMIEPRDALAMLDASEAAERVRWRMGTCSFGPYPGPEHRIEPLPDDAPGIEDLWARVSTRIGILRLDHSNLQKEHWRLLEELRLLVAANDGDLRSAELQAIIARYTPAEETA